MNIRGYDAWKLMSPDEDYESKGGKICPICGAYTSTKCEMSEDNDGECPWESMDNDGPDPDYLRDLKNERFE